MKCIYRHTIGALMLVLEILAILKSSTCASTLPSCTTEDLLPVLNVTPPSCIVRNGTDVVFRCEARNCQPQRVTWYKDEDNVISEIPPDSQRQDHMFRRNITADKNINIYCYYASTAINMDSTRNTTSNHATLEVAECPENETDFLTAKVINKTSIELQWLPPCLWPEHCSNISKFKIIVESRSDCDTTMPYSKMVSHNATQSISESKIINIDDLPTQDQTLRCREFFVKILAIDKRQGLLSKVGSKREYTSRHDAAALVFNDSSLDIEVFYKDSAILVKSDFELPGPICWYDELSYTITINNVNDNAMVTEEGPFRHSGSDPHVSQLIESELLEMGMNYSLVVNMSNVLSKTRYFYTYSAAGRPVVSCLTLLTCFILVIVLFII